MAYSLTTALDLCGWSTTDILFLNHVHSSQKIVKREFGCGAIDGTAPTIEIAMETHITSLFVYYDAIDTNQLDTKEWTRVLKK